MKNVLLPFLFASTSLLLGQVTLGRQVRIVVKGESKGMPENSFGRVSKTIYRLGTKFARIEEEFNPETNLKVLIITKAPDTWMVNLVAKEGRHIVDSDPNGKVVFPLFPKEGMPNGFPNILSQLEFGFEDDFFSFHKVPYTPMKAGGQELVKQYVGIDGWGVALIRKKEKGAPIAVFLFRDDDIYSSFRYLEYEESQPSSTAPFERPEGIKFSE